MKKFLILLLWCFWLIVTFWVVLQDHHYVVPVILGMGVDFIGAWYLRETMRGERRASTEETEEDQDISHSQ